MQIKTALAIGTGIVIGTVIGMMVDEKTKESISIKIKKRLIFSLTGEEWKPKSKKPMVNYRNYNSYDKVHYKKADTEDWHKYLIFDTKEEADERYKQICDFVHYNRFISVCDIEKMFGETTALDYTWDNYGWNETEISSMFSVIEVNGKYEIYAGTRPHQVWE